MKASKKNQYLRKCGDLGALYGIHDITYNQGRAKGVRAFEIKNGNGLNLSVFEDRGLDIPILEFCGINIGFLSKSGLTSPFSFQYSKDGVDSFLRQFAGGFLTTCGMTYCGAASREGDREFPLHGRLSNTIAENVYCRQIEAEDEVLLEICGDIKESRIFEENLVLHRQILVHTEFGKLQIHDDVENLGFREEPLMMIYHFNFGYPFLDAGSRIYFSADQVISQTPFAREGLEQYDRIEEPEDIREEQCYYHVGQENPEHCFAMIENSELGIAVVIQYRASQCPILCEWKSMQAGDYALGLEPTTNGTAGRIYAEEQKSLQKLKSQQHRRFDFEILFLNKQNEIEKWRSGCKESSKK